MFVLTGCAFRHQARVYPVCLYDTSPAESAQAAADWPLLRVKLVEAAALVTRKQSEVVLVNSRAAIVRTTRRQDKQLRSIWSQIACYGASLGTTSAQMLANCIEYVRAYTQSGSNGYQLPREVIVPPCQTLPGDVRPGDKKKSQM